MSDPATLPTAQQFVDQALGNYSAEEAGIGQLSNIEELYAEHGEDAVHAALANVTNEEYAKATEAEIRASDLPEAVKEEAIALLHQYVADNKQETTAAAQDDVNAIYLANIRDQAEEDLEAASKEASGKNGGSGGLNWLVSMMTALSKVAGEWLEKAVDTAEKIGKIGENGGSEAEQARETTMLQGKMQAYNQLFNMVFKAAAELGRTVGENMKDMARIR